MKKFFLECRFTLIHCIIFTAFAVLFSVAIDKIDGRCYNDFHKKMLIMQYVNSPTNANSVCYRCGISISPIAGDIGWHGYTGGTPYSIIELDRKLDAAKIECRNKIVDAVTEFWSKYPKDRPYGMTNLTSLIKFETEGLQTKSDDEKIEELEKKVLDQKICYPVYTPSPEEALLWDLKLRKIADDVVTNHVDVFTNVAGTSKSELHPGDLKIIEMMEKRKAEWIREHGTNLKHSCSFGTNCVLNPWVPHE